MRFAGLGTRVAVATLVVVITGVTVFALTGAAQPAAGRAPAAQVLGPGEVTVRLTVNYSRFRPARIVVRPHTTVHFEIANHDPIGHEFIVGDAEVHARHESGNHAQHGAVPGEVSVGPGEVGSTTFEFHVPGTVVYACHLPGHFAYGMVGEVLVRAAR